MSHALWPPFETMVASYTIELKWPVTQNVNSLKQSVQSIVAFLASRSPEHSQTLFRRVPSLGQFFLLLLFVPILIPYVNTCVLLRMDDPLCLSQLKNATEEQSLPFLCEREASAVIPCFPAAKIWNAVEGVH